MALNEGPLPHLQKTPWKEIPKSHHHRQTQAHESSPKTQRVQLSLWFSRTKRFVLDRAAFLPSPDCFLHFSLSSSGSFCNTCIEHMLFFSQLRISFYWGVLFPLKAIKNENPHSRTVLLNVQYFCGWKKRVLWGLHGGCGTGEPSPHRLQASGHWEWMAGSLPAEPTYLRNANQVWSLNQYQLHYVGAGWKCRLLGPTPDKLSQNLPSSKILGDSDAHYNFRSTGLELRVICSFYHLGASTWVSVLRKISLYWELHRTSTPLFSTQTVHS